MLQLIGIDMVAMPLRPKAFDQLSVEQAREILGRSVAREPSITWMSIDANLVERPKTFLIRIRDDSIGLIQLEETDGVAGEITVRYRLHRAR